MKIEAGIILGTGIDILPFVKVIRKANFAELNLIEPSVEGHSSGYYLSEIGGKVVGILSGRIHLYEGYTTEEVCSGVKFLKEEGASKIVITTAAGTVNRRFTPGSVMIIRDQINLTGKTPFDFKREKKFIDTAGIYNVKNFKQYKKLCNKFKIKLHIGTLAGVHGPAYETPAEVKMLKRMGADAVCMSTVLEAMFAHYLKMDVLGISVLTNYAGLHSARTHQEAISMAKNLSEVVCRIIEVYLKSD